MSELARPRIGDPAPPLDLLDESSERWQLEGLRGRWVVLVFHRHIH